MMGAALHVPPSSSTQARRGDRIRDDKPLVRFAILSVSFAFISIFLVLPLAVVFLQALARGLGAYWAALTNSDALAAIQPATSA